MNILFISSEYPPQTGFGGIGTYTRLMARALTVRGHSVEVIARSETGEPYDHDDQGVRVHRVGPGVFPLPQGRLWYRYRRFRTRFHYHSLVRLAFAHSVERKYRELTRGRGFDIVECAECGAEGYCLDVRAPSRLVVRLHTPFSYIARLDHLNLGFWDTRKLEALERGFTGRACAVSSPSQALIRILAPRWTLPKAVCYPNPMDASEYQPRRGKGDYIIYTGRVEYRKGVHVLLAAYARLVSEGLSLPLVLAGAPFGLVKNLIPYERMIEERIKALGLSDKVRWVKSAGREVIRGHLENAAVAVYPSLWENFPYACLEAMAAGVPVVASRCGGIEEMIVHGQSGLLCEPLNAALLHDALKQMLDDEALAGRLGRMGRERALTEYAPDRVAEAAERFYGEALHG